MKDKDRLSSILNALALSARSSEDRPDATPESFPDDETIAAFIDGTLDETDAARVRAHIASNPEAWIAYQALVETENIDGPPVPAHLIRAAKDLVGSRTPAAKSAAAVVVRMLKGTLELLDLKGLEVNVPPSAAAEPVRSGAASAARQGAERIEITSSIAGLEGLSLQKIEPSDVRITLEPTRDGENAEGRTLRVDLMHDDTLIQSWPLEGDTLSLEPVTLGCYTLKVFEHDTHCGASPVEIGAIAIELQ